LAPLRLLFVRHGLAPLQGETAAHVIYSTLRRPAVEEFNEYLSKYARAIDAARQRRPIPATGDTFPVGVESRIEGLARGHIEAILRTACPQGKRYLYHYLNAAMVNVRDFEAACDHFGLRGVIEDIPPEEVDREVLARKARGAAPSTGLLPMGIDEIMPREKADARIAIVERRIAAASERVAEAVPAA